MKKSQHLLILDLESTCWLGDPPAGQKSEIIEIGYCLYDFKAKSKALSGTLLVHPTKSEVSDFCTRLTTLTAEMLDEGLASPEVAFNEINKILKHERKPRLKDLFWASWGEYDRKMIERSVNPYPLGRSHLNLKSLAAMKFQREERDCGMAEILEYLQIPLEGTHHRAESDVKNIAKIVPYLI